MMPCFERLMSPFVASVFTVKVDVRLCPRKKAVAEEVLGENGLD